MQRKLRKLESELTFIFSLPPQSLEDRLKISEYIEKRFQFLRKLLSAEISSHSTEPNNLENFTRRFTELETAFREWENSNSTALTLAHEDFEPGSTSCWGESFVNDDGEKIYEELVEEKLHNECHLEEASAEMGWPDFEEAKNVLEGLKDEKKVSERAEKRGWSRKYGCVLAAGMVLVMALILGLAMVSFSGCFRIVKHRSSLTPT